MKFSLKCLLTLFGLFLVIFLQSQTYGKKSYYLVDSLPLTELSENDAGLIDTCMKIYHATDNDTMRIYALNQISGSLNHPIWLKYQDLMYDLIRKALKKQNSTFVQSRLNNYLVSALNNYAYIQAEQGELKKAIGLYIQCLELDIQLRDYTAMANDLNNIAAMQQNMGMTSLALKNYLLSARINEFIKNRKQYASSLHNVGSIYSSQGNIAKASEFYMKSLKIFEELKDEGHLASIYSKIATFYRNNKDYDVAMDYYFKSINVKLKTGDVENLSIVYGNLAACHSELNQLDSTLFYYNKAIDIAIKFNRKLTLGNIYNNIGSAYLKIGDPDKALSYLKEALAMNQETENNEGIINSHYHLGNWNYTMGHLGPAEEFAKKSLILSEKSGDANGIKANLGLLQKIYAKTGNYKLALEMRNKEIAMRDSLNSVENINAIAKMSYQSDYEKQKVIDKTNFEKKLAIEKEEKEKQTILKYAFVIGTLMLAVFLFVVFNRLKVTNKQKIIIEEARNELEVKNKEITDSISYAKRIQTAILPPQKLVKEFLPDSFVLYLPKDIVAGDFYWMEHVGDTILFAAADCTGHGVPGAMVSVVCHNALNRSVREYGLNDPGEILDMTRGIVIQEFEKSEEEVKDGMDISLCALNIKTRILKWAGANNPIWVVKKEDRSINEIKPNKQPIGKYAEEKPFETHTLKLTEGDLVYVFTDGYQDQFGGEKGKKFKASKLKELLISIQDKAMGEQREIIQKTFDSWKGSLEQVDDVTILGVRV